MVFMGIENMYSAVQMCFYLTNSTVKQTKRIFSVTTLLLECTRLLCTHFSKVLLGIVTTPEDLNRLIVFCLFILSFWEHLLLSPFTPLALGVNARTNQKSCLWYYGMHKNLK